MDKIRALIVDDEPLARAGLRELLEKEADIEVVGECGDGVAAVEAIPRLKPQLLLLDIQMPGLGGFGVIELLEEESLPAIIFVTAYDQFAIKAFETHALDYILKPVDERRFAHALDHARSIISLKSATNLSRQVINLLQDIASPSRYLTRLAVKNAGKISFVGTREIDWIGAEGDYVCVHAAGRKELIRATIGGLEEKLDPKQFARIHRSTIVNIDRIKELEPLFHGEYSVKLVNGTGLVMSRSYRSRLLALLERPS
jgi:two-component system LytT family response regulator